jgi:simple sugar transport system permease protein
LIVVTAFGLGAILILVIGGNPLQAYGVLVQTAFGSVNGFAETMVKACPLLLAGLGVAIAYRARFWNIGAEGQIYAGGIAAALVGIYLSGAPALIHLPLTLLAGLVGGGLLGLIPGYLKARLKVNEVITTLMLNYIVIGIASYLVHGPLRDRASGITISPQLAGTAWLPILISRTRFHWGIVLALLAAGLLYVLLDRTVFGFQVRAIGDNIRAARIAGIRVEWVIVWAVVLSGALAGLAGAVEVAGIQHRLVEGFSPGYGYLAIAVALLGNLKPLAIVPSAILFAALLNGAEAMQRAAGVPVSVIYVIEGLVIIFVSIRLTRTE